MNDDPPYQYDIQINNTVVEAALDEELLRQCVAGALRHFDVAEAEISVAVVGDEEITRLHREYLQASGSTDVLTFDLGNGAPRSRRRIDGEIVISADTARREARRQGHALQAEIALYAVHGTLHLVGLDDAGEQQARDMHRLEDDILQALGVGRVYGA